MENAVSEIEVLEEGAETTEMISTCCAVGSQSARK
jgi:hypothetical protein